MNEGFVTFNHLCDVFNDLYLLFRLFACLVLQFEEMLVVGPYLFLPFNTVYLAEHCFRGL